MHNQTDIMSSVTNNKQLVLLTTLVNNEFKLLQHQWSKTTINVNKWTTLHLFVAKLLTGYKNNFWFT